MQIRLRVITLQGAIEKNRWLDGTIIISYFGGSKNIFTECISYIKICKNWDDWKYLYNLNIKVGVQNVFQRSQINMFYIFKAALK